MLDRLSRARCVMRPALGLLAALAAAHGLPAQAHITLAEPEALAGSGYRAVFKVGHGCEGSAIRELVVHVPEGVRGAKPMPKPGWTLTVETEPLAEPYSWHGRTVREDVRRIRWSGGPLEDAHYDEFIAVVRLPETPGRLHWRVTQRCLVGEIDWAEVPAPGQDRRALKAPAAWLDLRPAPRPVAAPAAPAGPGAAAPPAAQHAH